MAIQTAKSVGVYAAMALPVLLGFGAGFYYLLKGEADEPRRGRRTSKGKHSKVAARGDDSEHPSDTDEDEDEEEARRASEKKKKQKNKKEMKKSGRSYGRR